MWDLADIGIRERTNRQRYINGQGRVCFFSPVRDGKAYYSFTWRDIDRIMPLKDSPVAFKGVQRGEDVVKAAKKGIKAIYVLSNHGGRQFDFSRSSLEILAEARKMLKEQTLRTR